MESQSIKPTLTVIVGETASGKSALALRLAKKFNGEIICADSRTVYKGMDIGTAKPTTNERQQIKHHLLDVVTPDQTFTAADFKYLAQQAIADVIQRGKLPILVGGTGLYIDSVLFDFAFSPIGSERDPQNPRHSKAINGTTSPKKIRPNTVVFGLLLDREELHQRIKKRVHSMLQQGLEQEVKDLSNQYGWQAPALTAVGYKEFKNFFSDIQNLAETERLIILHTIQYAKRQRTWFKRNNSIHWFQDPEKVVDLLTT